jgi:hypothetical protein
MSRFNKSSDRVMPISPKIDLDEIRSDVIHLKAHRDVKISDLKGDTLHKYKSIAEKLDLLHGTKHYSKFVDVIIDVFSDVHQYHTNTVGAYLNGCNVETNLDIPNVCMSICAGSIPSFQEGKNDSFNSWNSSLESVSSRNGCEWLVMQMNWDERSQSFTFVDLNGSKNTKKCYMYTTFNKSDWPGFNNIECEGLQGYGIEKVMIYHEDSTGKSYTPITEKWTSLKNIPHRAPNAHHGKKHCGSNCGPDNGNGNNPDNGNGNNPDNGNGSSNSNTAWIVFAIILIILLIIIAWAICSKRD